MRYLEVYGFSPKIAYFRQKILLNSFFLQNVALSHQTVLLASQSGVTESIPVTFGGPRCILDALDQFLSLRGPQHISNIDMTFCIKTMKYFREDDRKSFQSFSKM